MSHPSKSFFAVRPLKIEFTRAKCRRTKCRRKMPSQNAITKMLTQNAVAKCRRKMPSQNAITKMPTQNASQNAIAK
jgi:hypothetical protein